MEVINTEIEGVVIIEPRLFKDERGYFLNLFTKRFRQASTHHPFRTRQRE